MRRSLPLLVALAAGAAGLALAAPSPASASPSPLAAPASDRAHEAVPDQLLVGYVLGASDADRQRARGRAAAVREDEVVPSRAGRAGVELVRLPQGKDRDRAIAELQADPSVAYAEPNWVLQHQSVPTDPWFADGSLWGLKSATPTVGISKDPSNRFGTAAVEAWKTSTGDSQVYVGVIDEGIQTTHADLDGQVWKNPFEVVDGKDDDGNGYVDDVHGWDFAGNNNTVYDGGAKGNADDHGTHVAGTIGAEANGAGVVGVNHRVTLISGKFLGSRGGSLDNAVKAVDYFTDLKARHGLNIVATNNSWGGGGYSEALQDAVTRAAKADILFVAAAGNSGTDNDGTASYPSNYDTTALKGSGTEEPAAYDAVIAVAAIDSSGALATFSQYGARTVDLGAPGVGVWSTTAPGTYESYNGTSMATPHVTGAVALYEAAVPGSSAAEVKAALLRTAVPTSSLQTKTVTGGRLHIANALTGTVSDPLPAPEATSATVTLSKVKVRNYTEVKVRWTGFVGDRVTVAHSYDGKPVTEVNDGELVQNWTGSGPLTYTVCETDGSPCVSETITL